MDNRIKAVSFDEKEHKYWFNGKELHGVTTPICKVMGKVFPDNDRVKLATIYGSDVHKEVERYFNEHDHFFNNTKLSTEGAEWVIDTLKDFCNNVPQTIENIECEVMVSDFEGTASKVDVVVKSRTGQAWLFDIKTTSTFDRPYCSLQLSIYKRLYEQNYGMEVLGLSVLNTKLKRRFRILEQSPEKIDRILNMNKGV